MERRLDSNRRSYARCAEPTDALPGTKDKLAVLAEREARGEELWHEDDCYLGSQFAGWRVPLIRMDSIDGQIF